MTAETPRSYLIPLSGPEYDAVLTALRMLGGAMDRGEVVPDDGDLGSVLTDSGEHPGLSADQVWALGDRI